MSERVSVDVVVVGAGPAGSTAARLAAENGASVLLLEKDREVGIPVRCAEGVGESSLRKVLEPRPHWIMNTVQNAEFISPSGYRVLVHVGTDRGFVLNRKIFDYELAQMAADAGAQVWTKAYAYDLLRDENDRVAGVKVRHLGREVEVAAKVVIGADGVESRVGRWAGLKTLTKMHDMETCVQVTAARVEAETDRFYFFFGSQVAPGGYAWVFPKGNGLANVGLGLSGDFSAVKKPIDYLQELLDQHFPGAAILTTVAGGVPCSGTVRKLVTDGLMLVGDAAHQANPVSGGGIAPGMIAGKIAGRVAAEAVREGDVSEKRLREYVREWDQEVGKTHRLFYRIKEGIFRLTDEDLDRTAKALQGLAPEEITLKRMFRVALTKQPRLLLDVARVFVG